MAVPQTWDEYSRKYQQLVQNISTALNDRFGFHKAADHSIEQADFAAAVENVIHSDEKIHNQFRAFLVDTQQMFSQMHSPRADVFTTKQLNEQKGAQVTEKQRDVPDWAKSLMENAPPGESNPFAPNNEANPGAPGTSAENRAENRKKLSYTPGMDNKLENEPKLTAALKKDLEVKYTPKIKPSPF